MESSCGALALRSFPHPCNPIAALELFMNSVISMELPEPFPQIVGCDLLPIVDRDNRQASVEGIERRAGHQYDMAQRQGLPCPMAVQTHAVRAQHKGVLTSLPP